LWPRIVSQSIIHINPYTTTARPQEPGRCSIWVYMDYALGNDSRPQIGPDTHRVYGNKVCVMAQDSRVVEI
ncbi:MAG: hypothetical protein R6U40_06860, partial [Desulfobacterales bacterium]